ncbi:MAG TPA: OB-fold domain-containing protein, partial [Candidatus Kapabacteria bacterium]|nr:OB-fold domain-containing protein [Candidatus Kapabacteria bacterium]
NVAAKAVSGTGVVDTFTINHQKWHPKMEVPFVIARVALDDAPGVYLTTNIVGCEVSEVDIGDRVKVTFEKQDDIFLPLFVKTA